MKFIITICFVTVFSIVHGQSIFIGTGTANTLYGPIYIYSDASPNTHSWNLSIYDQSEIIAAGGLAGLITGISWYKTDTSSYMANDGTFEIYIKHTPLVEFNTAADFDFEVVGAVKIFNDSTMSILSNTGWLNFAASQAFNWNGVDNIMILTRWTRVGNATGPVNWQATSTTPFTRISHSFNSSPTMGTLYTSGNRPNLQFFLNTSTSVGKEIKENEIRIYPNPVKDFITIENVDSLYEILISDITGKIIFTKEIQNNNIQRLNIASLLNGIYTISIINSRFTFRDKFIVAN